MGFCVHGTEPSCPKIRVTVRLHPSPTCPILHPLQRHEKIISVSFVVLKTVLRNFLKLWYGSRLLKCLYVTFARTPLQMLVLRLNKKFIHHVGSDFGGFPSQRSEVCPCATLVKLVVFRFTTCFTG